MSTLANALANRRVIALVDMDCFYCQVEARLNPSLRGKPMAVVQYNQWKGGGIIAVNYEARDVGVTRGMRGDEAKEKCPEITLVSVPTIRGKADLTNYRDAGDEVAKVFSEFCTCVQRASIDEAYLDLTNAVEEYIETHSECLKPDDLASTFVVGYCNLKSKTEDERIEGLSEWLGIIESEKVTDNANYRLAIGGVIVEKMRSQIYKKTGFHCSAGIAHNKILAKLTAGLHKPKKQTILPHDNVPELYDTLPIYKVRNLGGKLGKIVSEKLSVKYMSELYKFSLQELHQKFDEKTGSWLYNIARGIDLDPVTPRLKPESIGCCKNFSGLNQLTKKSEVEHWVKELATEISERLNKDLERNKRRAKLLTVSFYQEAAMTRCGPLNSYEVNRIAHDALELLKKFNFAPQMLDLWRPPIKYLGLSVSKFTEECTSIEKFFQMRDNDCKEKRSVESSSREKTEIKKIEPKNSELNELMKASTSIDNKNVEVSEKPGTSGSEVESSFFLKFINEMNAYKKMEEFSKKNQNAPEDEDAPLISLSEIIPDINSVEDDVINILPEPLQKKFRERLGSTNQIVEDACNIPSAAGDRNKKPESTNREYECTTEICNECGENIRLDVFLEHLDYHAAVKLNSEINGTAGNSNKIIKSKITSEVQGTSKRKKSESEMHTKKMKSITSFFRITPKI